VICTALGMRFGCVERNVCETTIVAAPPSDVGQHWSLVRGWCIVGDERICSRL